MKRHWRVMMSAAATISALSAESANLLTNPAFRFQARDEAGRPGGATSHNVACWNTDEWGDITVCRKTDVQGMSLPENVVGAVTIQPGKRLYQFNTFPDLGCLPGDELSLSATCLTSGDGKLETRTTVMRIESADGTWSGEELGCPDKRTFSCHGRGELIRGTSKSAICAKAESQMSVNIEGLPLETSFEKRRESSAADLNAVGLLVEFVNTGTTGTVTVGAPILSKGPVADSAFTLGNPVPDYYRKLPNTLSKLIRGEPIHILALGSSIDTGDANPRLYIYDEDPTSPTYKQPLWSGAFNAEGVGRPDLKDYIGAAKQYVKYTGRLRRELMRKFNRPVSDIFLNAMSCGGSSIGESHSGFKTYTDLKWEPGPANGHPKGKPWTELYPQLFAGDAPPPPDLVIFGHGHNERIDSPDGIAVYEGAIRWFQKRYPNVEFLFCQWHMSPKDGNIPPISMRQKLCEYYGIPFINIIPTIEALTKDWCNHYALCPDGGHPQAGAHTIWFRHLERMFEMADPLEPFEPQKHLPPRMNEYAYGWEGDKVTYMAPHERIRGNRMIIDDSAFNLWCGDGAEDWMTIVIDGEPLKRGPAGNGRQMTRRDERNSSFVHGRLSLGDRHILEVKGKEEVKVVALDCKIAPHKAVFPCSSSAWKLSQGVGDAMPLASEWGAPYGDQLREIAPGNTMAIDVEGTDLAIAYVDKADGGTLKVSCDEKEVLTQPTNIAFTDADGKAHYLENRRGICGLGPGKHHVVIEAQEKPVRILALYAYDRAKFE